MPTQRFEGKRVEERVGEGEGEREREKEHTHVGERAHACRRQREREHTHVGEKERVLWLLLLYVFASTWAALCKLGLARSAVRST